MADESKIGESKSSRILADRNESPGRRGTDRNTCAMHDYLQNKNDHCFDIVKDTIKEEVRRRDHKFEIIENRLEDKFELVENRLEGYISKWALGIIVLVSLTLLGGMFGFAVWQVKSLKENMDVFGNRVIEMNLVAVNSLGELTSKIAEVSVRQEGIMRELEKFTPEHKMLMDHLIKSEDKGQGK